MAEPPARPRTPAAEVPATDPPAPPWDTAGAVRLQVAADGEVERLGGRGSHPDVRAAAARVVEAHRRRDLAGVRRACEEVAGAARRLAGIDGG